MAFNNFFFIRHTRAPHHGHIYRYPHDPGDGYWVHDAHTGNALAGPFESVKEARLVRREMLGLRRDQTAAASVATATAP